jgi:hypothetical protein
MSLGIRSKSTVHRLNLQKDEKSWGTCGAVIFQLPCWSMPPKIQPLIPIFKEFLPMKCLKIEET